MVLLCRTHLTLLFTAVAIILHAHVGTSCTNSASLGRDTDDKCSPEVFEIDSILRDANTSSACNHASDLFTRSRLQDQIIMAHKKDVESAKEPLYEIKPSPGKGLGVFAINPIQRGTHIIVEPPLLSVTLPPPEPGLGFLLSSLEASLLASFNALTPSEQAAYLALARHDIPSDPADSDEEQPSELMERLRDNGFNTGTNSVGMFVLAARINHSCRPNVGNYWSALQAKRIIYAARDIAAGEELTVSYIPLLMGTNDRQARLMQYGFICDCDACRTAGSRKGGESDSRRVEVGMLLERLEEQLDSRYKVMGPVTKAMVGEARRIVQLLDDEALTEPEYLARAYSLVAAFEKGRGRYRFEEARVWAEKEIEVRMLAESESEGIVTAKEFLISLTGE